eukprot:6092925-Pyramimonas_sp.AAC.1
MYACQIFEAANRELPGLDKAIAAGEFGGLKRWLNEKVHAKGSLYPSGDLLMEQVRPSGYYFPPFYLRTCFALLEFRETRDTSRCPVHACVNSLHGYLYHLYRLRVNYGCSYVVRNLVYGYASYA